jgi:hypothetical protein
MTDNLELWKSVEKTDPKHVKAITGKSYQGNSPKPHYLVHKATETFGPIGIGWGFTIEDERIEDGAGGERMHIARVKVWFKWRGERGEVEHIGGTQFSGVRSSGKPFTDEDAPKKSVTDALVKALSMIGFAGDIFMGRYDDSKYVSALRAEAEEAEKPAPKAESRDVYARLSKANNGLTTLAAFDKLWNHQSTIAALDSLPRDWRQKMHDEKTDKAAELAERAAMQGDDFLGDTPLRAAVPPNFDGMEAR